MTKTKRQLRAEAVERVERLRGTDCDGSVLLEAIFGEAENGWTVDSDIDAFRDLLNDDEPSEGDAVSIMRKVARGDEVTGNAMRKEVGGTDWADALLILADMVERDYVRRDEHERIVQEMVEANMRQCERTNELTAERDYWKGQVQLCLDAAYPPSHSPEPPYAPEVMDYPTHDGYTTPSTLVSCVIDGLRDAAQDGFFKARFGDVVRLKIERDNLARDLEDCEREREAWRRACGEMLDAYGIEGRAESRQQVLDAIAAVQEVGR